ncbi:MULTISPECIES: hypothetical protein [unclassified Kitasatospora]|uniref:hypothetical protein n=1 Tax=unclassified Kitasatospora TaxID=2633591 RepID=UPI00070EBC08|nr:MULTISPECIES: hypothetical protein [unclassified Kitasatospora]KQV04589.1 hypothetical protein ASC99_14430 [Kitasatospora sp. Root107]KRB60884.1 hypothetical protein ASE03_11080 [Kitasatospora sp. Root187]
MPTQIPTPVRPPAERSALAALLTEAEAPVSGAPLYCPATSLALLLLLSPKEPKDPRRTG